ncbi:MAG: hypothetical protein BRD50_06100 [Bacteroidetes bacterium SW_11_45_7]|nr:MAG: hypothetical protein BRD50_06100 [Bacteroidetes bacterium SW_11_45_7]
MIACYGQPSLLLIKEEIFFYFMRKEHIIIAFLFILGMPLLLQAQETYKITGRVIDDQTQEPVPFANVYLQGTSIGTTTDQEGYYTIETSQKADTIICSAVGYSKIKKSVARMSILRKWLCSRGKILPIFCTTALLPIKIRTMQRKNWPITNTKFITRSKSISIMLSD